MKKRLKIFALIPLLALASCAGEPSSSTTSQDNNNSSETTQDTSSTTTIKEKTIEEIFEEKLNLLKEGYVSTNIISETYFPNGYPTQSTSSKSINETSAIDDKFTIKFYNITEQGEPIQAAMETVYNIEGDACNGRININNEITYFKILHPSGNGVFRFIEDGYSNFFKSLKVSDFIKTSERTFTLKKEEASLNKVYKDIGTQLYGNPGFSIKHFSIFVTEDNHLQATTMFNNFKGKEYTYKYSFESEITPIVKDEFDDRNETYRPVKDEKFEKAIASLKSYNFTMTQDDIDGSGEVNKRSTLLLNKDKFYSQTFDSNGYPMNLGIYLDGETYQKVTKTNENKYIKGETSTKEEFLNYYAPFKINRAVFDYDGKNTYTLKKQIDGDTYVFSPYETDSSELNETTIEILQDKIVITNAFGKDGNKVVSTFTNIGKTDVGYTKDSVVDASNVTYDWKDVLTNENLLDLENFLSDLSILPTPDGLNDLSAFNYASFGNARQISYASASMPASEENVTNYGLKLVNAGWQVVEGENVPTYTKNNIFVQIYTDGATMYIDLIKQ